MGVRNREGDEMGVRNREGDGLGVRNREGDGVGVRIPAPAGNRILKSVALRPGSPLDTPRGL